MELKDVLSLSIFIVFIVSYSAKLIIQAKRNRINAFVLGMGAKPEETKTVEWLVRISTLIWGTVWVVESLFNRQIFSVTGHFFDSSISVNVGLLCLAAGLMIFIKAMIDMRSSWRVGIDKETKSKLVSRGIYRLSRNPAFVGFDLMFAGVFITYPNILTLVAAIVNMIALHLLILQEEKHLKASFGRQYTDYMNRTPRYFG